MIKQSDLKKLLTYLPETGEFFWCQNIGSAQQGKKAGTLNKTGYIHIQIYGRRYGAHRLAWLYMTGEWPKRQIDHRNRHRNDNRWSNLRKATKSQNCANTVKYKNNTSGFRGVSWHSRDMTWVAYIYENRCRHVLGSFKTKEDAACAYDEAARRIFGEYAALNFSTKTHHK
jgi:hypothetical protein